MIDVETVSEKETDEDQNSEEQKTDEDEIQENGENNFFEESNPEDAIEVELIVVENNVIEEQIPVVEQPAAEERIHSSRNNRKNLDNSMDIVTMIKTIPYNTLNIRESILRGGGQCLAQMNARGHAQSRRVLQLTNGGERKDSTSSRAVAVKEAYRQAFP